VDPDELLKRIIENAGEELNDIPDEDLLLCPSIGQELASDVLDLIEWLAKDGFAPNWKAACSWLKCP
jgi:hypothetical protein